jgi:hypothetical protein
MRGIQAVPRNRKRTQEHQRQARHLLMELDPIGVSNTPEAAGEYDCMIGPLLHRLSHGTASITPGLITRFAAVVTTLAPSWCPPQPRPPL